MRDLKFKFNLWVEVALYEKGLLQLPPQTSSSCRIQEQDSFAGTPTHLHTRRSVYHVQMLNGAVVS